ncbi:MAG: hypothetical protein QXX63_01215 [Thermoplasmatales archaeon]
MSEKWAILIPTFLENASLISLEPKDTISYSPNSFFSFEIISDRCPR